MLVSKQGRKPVTGTIPDPRMTQALEDDDHDDSLAITANAEKERRGGHGTDILRFSV